MKIDAKKIVEVAGLLGIIGSLFFVGIEIQQANNATRSATVLQLKESWLQFNLISATNVELAKAFEEVSEKGFDKSSFVNKSLISGFYRSLFHNSSNAYYQFRVGVLDDELWYPHRVEIETLAGNDAAKKVWKDWKHLYDLPFQALVDAIVEKPKYGT